MTQETENNETYEINPGFCEIEYEGGDILDSIVMGAGTVQVYPIYNHSGGYHGVAFGECKDPDPQPGKLYPSSNGKKSTDVDIKHQWLFNNPESVDVVLEMLEKIKVKMTKKCPRCKRETDEMNNAAKEPYCRQCQWPHAKR